VLRIQLLLYVGNHWAFQTSDHCLFFSSQVSSIRIARPQIFKNFQDNCSLHIIFLCCDSFRYGTIVFNFNILGFLLIEDDFDIL
jgi:hypothetical protein